VNDINSTERNAAIAWRFERICGGSITKTAVAKLLKELKI